MNRCARLLAMVLGTFLLLTGTARVALAQCSGGPQVFTCIDENAYLTQLSALGLGSFSEGFEDDTAWGDVRRTASASDSAVRVISNNIAWMANHPLPNAITTGIGAALTGRWGIFDPLHGSATGTVVECDVDSPPEHCLHYDGVTGTREASASTLYAVGGYIRGTFGAKIEIRAGLDRYELRQLSDSAHHFFGVIDTRGFNAFQIREIESKIGQKLIIFADDFTFGVGPTANNVPIARDDTASTLGNIEWVDGGPLSFVLAGPINLKTAVGSKVAGKPTSRNQWVGLARRNPT